MSEEQLPKLRLENHRELWDERSFGDLAQRKARTTADDSLPQVEYEDIESYFGILNKDVNSKTTRKPGIEFSPGDVLFGKLRPYLKNWLLPDFCGIAVGDFWVLQGNDCDPAFLYNLIQGTKFTSVSNISSGSKMPRSDWGLVSQTTFMTPTSLQEQRAIGGVFSQFDSLVNKHRQEHQQLQQTKSALMQRMFPQDGADAPELRVEGYRGEWRSGPLLEVMTSVIDFRGRTPKKLGLSWSETGHLALSANNVKQGYIDFRRDPHYGDDELYEKWMVGRELHMGQVLFTTEAPMGNVAQVTDSRKYILSQRVIAFEVDEDRITEDFLRVLLGSPAVFAQLTSLSSGGTAQGVSQRSLAQVQASMPEDVGEQSKIAEIFTKLDSLISAKQIYVDKLIRVKSGLLQKMFI